MFHSGSFKYGGYSQHYSRQTGYELSENHYGKYYRPLPASPMDRRKEGTPFNEREFKKLIEAVENNSMQSDLVLSKRCINDQQFISIIKAILSSRIRICHLSLSENFISDMGIEKVIPLLQISAKFVTIDLSYNSINERGGFHLLEILKTNTTIVKLNLFKNPIKDSRLIELQQLIERNVEIQAERQRYYHYIASVIIAKNNNFPIDITNMVLEYCNEASILEARQYVARTLYLEAMQFVGGLEEPKLWELSENILNKASKLKQQPIARRLEIIQEQYGNSDVIALTFNQEALRDSSQQESTLLFSKLGGIDRHNSPKQLQKTDYRRKSCFSRFCSIL